jgi:hypothetical protein
MLFELRSPTPIHGIRHGCLYRYYWIWGYTPRPQYCCVPLAFLASDFLHGLSYAVLSQLPLALNVPQFGCTGVHDIPILYLDVGLFPSCGGQVATHYILKRTYTAYRITPGFCRKSKEPVDCLDGLINERDG